jgi:hypothetical protein
MDIKTPEGLRLSGKIKIDTYAAGLVEAITPLLDKIRDLRIIMHSGSERVRPVAKEQLDVLIRQLDELKASFHIRTAVECHNLIMGSSGYGLDIIIQRLVGINTYSLNILYGEIGTGTTTPTLGDTALTTPTNRAAVGYQQDYGSTDAIVQFFFSDSQLSNTTYNEFGTFIDGTTTIGSGRIFNHALISGGYTKVAGQDSSVQVDISLTN